MRILSWQVPHTESRSTHNSFFASGATILVLLGLTHRK